MRGVLSKPTHEHGQCFVSVKLPKNYALALIFYTLALSVQLNFALADNANRQMFCGRFS